MTGVALAPALAVVAGALVLRAVSRLRWRRPGAVTARSSRRRLPGWAVEVAAAAPGLSAGRVYAAWLTSVAGAPVAAVAAGP
ncbi:MAG: hypothetical protein KY443_08410, partial [Actinobacteria bacterium]|nr:hypothetical protein [Actinomycetota bacterium]